MKIGYSLTPQEREVYRKGILPVDFPGDARKKLDQIGPQLHRLMVVMTEQEKLVKILWKRYLVECAKRKVKAFSGGQENGDS